MPKCEFGLFCLEEENLEHENLGHRVAVVQLTLNKTVHQYIQLCRIQTIEKLRIWGFRERFETDIFMVFTVIYLIIYTQTSKFLDRKVTHEISFCCGTSK